MSDRPEALRRRTVLKSATGALASAAFVGTVSGTGRKRGNEREAGRDRRNRKRGGRGKTRRYNAGFVDDDGRKAVLDRAAEVHHEFAFGAACVDLSRRNAKRLERDANVRYLEEDVEMYALQDSYPWGVERVDADAAHEAGETGAGAEVTIVDSGVDPAHVDLEENVGDGECFVECAGDCETCWDDDNGHGTHVAGTVAAARDGEGVVGVAPESTIHAAKVLDANGAGSAADIAAAVQWSADEGHDVANLSLGGGYSSLVHDACRYAHERGVLLVAAAGNDGCYDCVNYPAALNEVVAVSATNENDGLANFSSHGPEIELAAPGVDIPSTYPGDSYAESNGTSMAAPHVAGAGAHLLANGYTNAEARQRLRNTATDVGLPSFAQGYGLVDVAAALGIES